MGFEPTHPKALAPQASVSTIPPPAHKKRDDLSFEKTSQMRFKKPYAAKYGLA